VFGAHRGSGAAVADALTPAPDVDPLVEAVPAGLSDELEGSSDGVDCGAGDDCVVQPMWMPSGRTITQSVAGCDCPEALGAADATRRAKQRIESAIRWGSFGTGVPFHSPMPRDSENDA
jgi:hypothetical protein